MTNEEIIKGLECCKVGADLCKCCPYQDKGCTHLLFEHILEFINNKSNEIDTYKKLLEKYEAEIGRLQKYNTNVAFKHYNDGVKDFAERLRATYPPREDKKCTLDDCYTLDVIDNLLKEMIKSEE